MRIAVFVEFFPPNLGSDRRIYEIMTRLSTKHEIHFFVLPPFRMLSGKISSPQHYLHSQHWEIIRKREGITAHYLSVSPLLSKLWKKSYALAYLLTMCSLFFKALKATKRIDPETIVLNYPSVYTGILGFVIGKKLLRKPVLLDFNDLIAQYTLRLLGFGSQSLTARFFVFAQNFIVRNSDKIIAPTDYIRKYASRLSVADEKTVVIPNGVDTRHFDPKKYSERSGTMRFGMNGKRTCMYCGRLDSWAGTEVILQLSKKLARDVKTTFVIVGSGVEESGFHEENVVSIGEVPYERVPETLAKADVILVPFPDNEVSRAASPLKLFEGMAMGKPIVASKVDGIEEVISNRENGLLVDPSCVNEWLNAVNELLDDDSLAKLLGEHARQTVEERYDWRLLAERYQRILTEKSGI